MKTRLSATVAPIEVVKISFEFLWGNHATHVWSSFVKMFTFKLSERNLSGQNWPNLRLTPSVLYPLIMHPWGGPRGLSWSGRSNLPYRFSSVSSPHLQIKILSWLVQHWLVLVIGGHSKTVHWSRTELALRIRRYYHEPHQNIQQRQSQFVGVIL